MKPVSATHKISEIHLRFQQSAVAHPSRLALAVGNSRLSYSELLEQVVALSDGLADAGVGAGDHIGVLLPNCAEFVLVLLAGARLGAVIVPQSMGLSDEALESTFRAADVRHLISWAGVVGNLSPATVDLATRGVRITAGGAKPGWTGVADIIARGRAASRSAPLLPNDLPYLMVLTSGSTGKPKPIVLSQHTKVLRAEAAAALYGATDADIILAATPLYHSLAQRLVLMPLMLGGTSILMEHFTPTLWIDAVRRERVSFSVSVSSQIKQILTKLIAVGETLPSLRCLVSSSAVLDDGTKGELLEHLKCEFHECYGASEVAIATNLSPEDATLKLGSVGRAIPGIDDTILTSEGEPAAPGTVGEIACRTNMLFSGYYRQPDTTTASMWGSHFRTGDLGRVDHDGYLFFLGRIKDIIITGGVNVYPKDIEEVIASHPAVKECAAIPVLDEGLGEVVGVVVAFDEENAASPPIREIQRLCMQRLGDFQQPRRFFVLNELPKNAMGKLDKPTLRKIYSNSKSMG
ncbi:class I adenylate-forming enzyme family protein [Rhodoblastus sp.]|uniref:class I adenylate-forming enzyme family protein n=1 Tax=Rhodoblastus sp. TaxID=1962975 RepID=UPI003F9A6CF0